MKSDQLPTFVGVDVGGTNVTAALVSLSGDVIARARRRTPRDGAASDTLKAVVEAVSETLGGVTPEERLVEAIGIGVAGVVDADQGIAVATPNMNLSGVAVVEPLEREFGVSVALGNDVDLGTLGEEWLGAARGAQSVVGIFVGTGIGGGLIHDGRLVRGARNAAGEIGHIVMMLGGPECGCGNHGCLEALASRLAIERDIRAGLDAGRKSIVPKLLDGDLTKRIRSGTLKKALKAEDALVTDVMRRASEVLGYACLTVRHLIDPEVIVLGGGVIEACGDFVMPIVLDVLASDKLPGAKPGGKVVRSTLGDDAVVLGAVALAQQHMGHRLGDVAVADDPDYPTIDGTRFGEVTIDGTTYDKDVYVFADGQVKKRKKSLAKDAYGTSHKIGPKELARVCRGNPEVLVIGTGQNGGAELTSEGERFLKEHGVEFRALPTPKAVKAYSDLKARKAALIHVTC